MNTDFENELRDLFREKAGKAPLATPTMPASAPQQVLRRGRLHQAGTVLGSAVVVVALLVGSVAGLTRILGDGPDMIQTAEYEVFQRTATIEPFTITSPSDWYLVNRWPGTLTGDASSGSSVFQLSNVDLGLDRGPCPDAPLPAGAAILSATFTGGHIIDSDPNGPWPAELREAGPYDTCGAGQVGFFTVYGWGFWVWVGFGDGVTDADRAAMMAALDSISVADRWNPPNSPVTTTPAYVIAGGTSEDGEPWRLDLRPGERSPELFLEGVDPALLGVEPGRGQDTVVPAIPIEFCCGWTDGTDDTVLLETTFGFVRKDATGVELQVREGDMLTGQILPGTIVPVPPSLGSFDFDLFFIPGTAGLAGQVVPVGIDGTEESPHVAEPRADEVELAGDAFGRRYRVRFTGAFADDTACIHVTVNGEGSEPLCPSPVETSLAGDQPSLHVVNTADLAVVVGSVPPEVAEIRFTNDSGNTQSQFQCQMGPIGWTDPDRRVCAIALPPQDGGLFEYLDPTGRVLFEEGMGWGVAEPEVVVPVPMDPVHGGTYWAVYPWLGAPGSPEADDVSAQLLAEFGIEAFPGDLSCDDGAAEALGTDAAQGIGVYFETQDEANAFASQVGLLGHEAEPVIAQVTTYCLD